MGSALPIALVAQERPNIIYIMTDQQTATAMSCAGNMDVHTPNMDKLAQRGVRFENAYCALPLSGPSRAAMFTGHTPGEVGMQKNGTPMPDSLRSYTLGTLMEQAGYETAYAGKWHVHTNSLPGKHAFGFENLHGHNDYGLAEASVEFLKRKHDKPFFLVSSFDNPHNICEYARNQNLPYATVEEPKEEDLPNLPANFNVAPYDADVLAYEKRQSYRLYPTQGYTPDDWRRYLNAYYRLIETVDAEIGKIINEIDRQNLWKNTVIIFTSDHGDGAAAHQWNQKTVLYEEVVNVPFIVCLPNGKHAGKVMPQLINNGVDLMPTICDWAGVEKPQSVQGVSFRSIVENGDTRQVHQPYVVTETVFAQTGGTQGWMVRTPQYKYVLYEAGKNREMLYDMENDRGEMRNLAIEGQYKEIVNRHRQLLREWMQKHPVPGKFSPLRFIPEQLLRTQISLRHWTAEDHSGQMKIEVLNDTLDITAPKGLTLWYNTRLTGDYEISYRVKVLMQGGKHDRLSDLNCFWAANDPQHHNDLYARATWRQGIFQHYRSLNLFYVGYGGNNNTTTRFRQYFGGKYDMEDPLVRPVIEEYTDPEHLLKPNEWYHVRISVRKGITTYYMNGEELFRLSIKEGEGDGHFGLRLLQNHVLFTDFRITTPNT